ncbi:MAG: sigma-70 family RNA polymerase sigma factor [Phycisphaera sp.]|nr:sigma-70 family RNA polymerase sigma factor [Phycisphaera sp.]
MKSDDTNLTPERETELVEAALAGDRNALGTLLTCYQKRVYHLCLRMVSNPDDAADITQDVLVRAIQHLGGFRQGSRFSTWLFRIAMNAAISHLRRSRVRSALSLESTYGGDDTATPLKAKMVSEREPGPAESVEQDEQVQQLMRALDALDTQLRSVILLRDLEEMDYQQIADVLNVPLGTVKSRLFRARLALRQIMEGRMVLKSEVSDG